MTHGIQPKISVRLSGNVSNQELCAAVEGFLLHLQERVELTGISTLLYTSTWHVEYIVPFPQN